MDLFQQKTCRLHCNGFDVLGKSSRETQDLHVLGHGDSVQHSYTIFAVISP